MTRIISGSAGGRRIEAPAGGRTRPTTDRVREAVFSAITSWAGTAAEPSASALSGISFLDLYAGSAAMGIEAASRGAERVHVIESAKPAATVARANAASLGLSIDVSVQRVETALSVPPVAGFDIVWADPPYDLAEDDLNRVIAAAVANRWLVGDGLLVIERSSRSPDPTWPAGFDHWSRRYGETTIHYAQRQGESS